MLAGGQEGAEKGREGRMTEGYRNSEKDQGMTKDGWVSVPVGIKEPDNGIEDGAASGVG